MNAKLQENDAVDVNTKRVISITEDLRDGTLFADLISHLAKVTLQGIFYANHERPLKDAEKLSNVSKVIEFMNSMRISDHPNPNDIVNGDVNVTMKLIFSLACHYKRESPSPQSSAPSPCFLSPVKRDHNRLTMFDIARDAADSLSDARKDVTSYPLHNLRPRSSPHSNSNRLSADSGIPSLPVFDDIDLESQNSLDDSRIGDIIEESCMEVQSLSESLYQLQEMLLTDSNDPDDPILDDQELAELRVSRCSYAEQANNKMRRDLIESRNLCRILQADKDSLAKRLNQEKENSLKTKSEYIRREFNRENLVSLRINLENSLREQDLTIVTLKRELAIEKQINTRVSVKPDEQDAAKLRQQISDLQKRLLHVSDVEDQLEFKIKAHESRMSIMQERILNSRDNFQTLSPCTFPITKTSPSLVHRFMEEDVDLRLAKKTLVNLKHTLHPPIPLSKGDQKRLINDITSRRQMAAIETLEYSITKLATKLNNSQQENQALNFSLSLIKSPPNKFNGSKCANVTTKIVYHTDKSNTPYMTSIHKRLGQITLCDIRDTLGNSNHYRYHFKTEDPDFGTVKEEIINDTDLVPGWDGKIVVWISTDHG